MISAACKRKSIERVDVVEEHFQLTLVLSLEVGEKFFISTRTTFHFETFLCTQASFVESFLSIKTIGGIKLSIPPTYGDYTKCDNVWHATLSVVKSNNFFPYCIVTWFQFYFHSICHD